MVFEREIDLFFVEVIWTEECLSTTWPNVVPSLRGLFVLLKVHLQITELDRELCHFVNSLDASPLSFPLRRCQKVRCRVFRGRRGRILPSLNKAGREPGLFEHFRANRTTVMINNITLPLTLMILGSRRKF